MASTYSTNLRLELIGTGEQQGTWGITTNTNLGTLLEQAIGGYEAIPVTDGADTTLTVSNGLADQSRNMTLNFTGALTAARNVICPAIEKVYFVKNSTTGGFAVTLKVSGQTGVSIPNGQTALVYVDGTDVRVAGGQLIAGGGTGATSAGQAMANLMGYTTTATSGGTTTLTASSSIYQVFTGSANHTVQLPVVSTLQLGWFFHINNSSTGTLSINSSGGNLLQVVPPNTTAMTSVISTSGTTASSWESGLTDFSTYTGTGSVVLNTDPVFGGKVGIGNTSNVSLGVIATDAILVPVGTTAQRPTAETGLIRYNTSTSKFEGYGSSAWAAIGGGATGGGADAVFFENDQTVTVDYTITTGKNAGTFGPIAVNSGITVTVPSGSTWSIV